MKTFPYKITAAAVLFLVFLLLSGSASAQYKLETALPGVGELPAGSELPTYINYLFVFGLGSIGLLALAVMMFGGIQYVLAAGSIGKTTEAKEWIKAALTGMGLLLVSYLLLRTINPDLVKLKNPSLTPSSFNIPEGQFITGGAPGTNLIKCGTTNCVSTEICNNGACQAAAPPIAP